MSNDVSNITLYSVGDIAVCRDDPDSIFQKTTSTLKKGDINFCQLEGNLSKRGSLLPHLRHSLRYDPALASALRNTGFKVVSFASNHCMDWGPEAFLDTLDNLKQCGLSVIGVGRNIDEARRLAIFECKGTKIAFLAYNSILWPGYWAEANRPGCNPMRAWTFFEPIEPNMPGTTSRIRTFANQDDLKTMVDDIKKAKMLADIVIISIHWGIHFTPAILAEYQIQVGHAAIDAGADLILGHHPHILKGVEVYARKAILYSIGNFALEFPPHFESLALPEISQIKGEDAKWQPFAQKDPQYLSYPFHPDARKTVIVKCVIVNKAIKNLSLIPTYINGKAEPETLSLKDDRFNEVAKYIEEVSKKQGFTTGFTIKEGEITIDL